MKLESLLRDFLSSKVKDLVIGLLENEKSNDLLEMELSTELTDFIIKFSNQEEINNKEFDRFCECISPMDYKTKKFMSNLISYISNDIYKSYEKEIKSILNDIEYNLQNELPIPKIDPVNNNIYTGLLNILNLFSKDFPIYSASNTIEYDVPFAINALRLVGSLPKFGYYNDLDLGKPCYPLKLQKQLNSRFTLEDLPSKSQNLKEGILYLSFSEDNQSFQYHLKSSDGSIKQRCISVQEIQGLKLPTTLWTLENYKDRILQVAAEYGDLSRDEREPHRKGIKNSDEFFPFKRVLKLFEGDAGNNTFLATNGNKLLFVRGVPQYSPNSVLASKIAKLVSPKHFSSERLLDNYLVASRKLPSFAHSVAESTLYKSIKSYVHSEKRVFPGSGIIAEVTNYVDEGDPNAENYGLSSNNFNENHLSKIDFDHCSFGSKLPKKSYDKDQLTKPTGIYNGAVHVPKDANYIKEKLYARLKLSMLPEPLLLKLADKAYRNRDKDQKEKAASECCHRSNLALELYVEHSGMKHFMRKNPNIINECRKEIIDYIQSHFDPNDQEHLITSLDQRIVKIKNAIAVEFSQQNLESFCINGAVSLVIGAGLLFIDSTPFGILGTLVGSVGLSALVTELAIIATQPSLKSYENVPEKSGSEANPNSSLTALSKLGANEKPVKAPASSPIPVEQQSGLLTYLTNTTKEEELSAETPGTSMTL